MLLQGKLELISALSHFSLAIVVARAIGTRRFKQAAFRQALCRAWLRHPFFEVLQCKRLFIDSALSCAPCLVLYSVTVPTSRAVRLLAVRLLTPFNLLAARPQRRHPFAVR